MKLYNVDFYEINTPIKILNKRGKVIVKKEIFVGKEIVSKQDLLIIKNNLLGQTNNCLYVKDNEYINKFIFSRLKKEKYILCILQRDLNYNNMAFRQDIVNYFDNYDKQEFTRIMLSKQKEKVIKLIKKI